MTAKTSGGAMNRRQPEGRTPIGPGDRADERDRPQADERRGDDRPEVDVGRDWVGRNVVERRVRHDEARRRRGDQCGRKRRNDQPQSQRATQHFERKQGAAERHAIDRGHAGPGADRDDQAALFVRELLKAREQIAEHHPELLGSAFAAERSAHGDNHNRQDRGAKRSPRRHAAGLKPDRRRDVDAVAAGEPGQAAIGPTLIASPAASSKPRWRWGLACHAASSSAEGSAAPQASS